MDAKGKKRMTHHHYMKLVETFFEEIFTFRVLNVIKFLPMMQIPQMAYTYQFTKHSHSYVTPKGIAQAKFQFDIDPMAVKVSEDRVPTMRFITSLCAIVGGAYAVVRMIDGTLFRMFG